MTVGKNIYLNVGGNGAVIRKHCFWDRFLSRMASETDFAWSDQWSPSDTVNSKY